uniref:Uncharacterized protein n=1 Tax=Rhizophora mucronata TaxID=61149 RepID=A0A2P2Q1N1_RHIMU
MIIERVVISLNL